MPWASVIYLELFIALFFLPGFFITLILGLKRFRFLLSVALSYSLLVLTLLPFEFSAQPVANWTAWIKWEWLILAALAAGKILLGAGNLGSSIRVYLKSRHAPARLLVPVLLAGAACGYLAYAGPYLELPADAWEHLRRFKWFESGAAAGGTFGAGFSLLNILAERLRWYFLHAWLCRLAGLGIIDSLPVLTWVNTIVFLLAIYYFGLFVFAGLRTGVIKKMMMAAFASIFAAATMGNLVFAYVRYYAFAPAILNYALFLAALAVILAWMRSGRWLGPACWIAPVLAGVTGLIHRQETAFIFFMTLALGIAETVRLFRRRRFGRPEAGSHNNGWTVREWKTVILTAALAAVFIAGFAVIRFLKPGSWMSAAMIMPNVPLPLEPVNFIFKNLEISPPVNPWLRLAAYQLFIFYQVAGCWGLFVYGLFILMARRLARIPYLAAGMIGVPLLTVFNPMLIDMMARVGQAPALYRFLYLIPLPFSGAWLLVHFWDELRKGMRRPRSCALGIAASLLVLAGLIGLIFPVNAFGIYAPYSKIYTLRRIPAGNDHRLYADLEQFIAGCRNKVILSDGRTAGFLWYFAPDNTYGWIRWLSSEKPENIQPEPYTWEFLRGRGLIVVNCRDGAPSITGRIARHWPEDILKVSRLYSLEARNYLESHPEKFLKIWHQNQIAIYAVR